MCHGRLALRPRGPHELSGTGSPGRPPRPAFTQLLTAGRALPAGNQGDGPEGIRSDRLLVLAYLRNSQWLGLD